MRQHEQRNKPSLPEQPQGSTAVEEFLPEDAVQADGQYTQPAEQEAAPVRQETARERYERLQTEEDERRKKEFYDAVMESRKPPEEPHKPQPVAPRIMAQTEAEMAAGRAMNEHHAKLQALRPVVQKSDAEKAAEGNSTPVFRPDDYAPDFNHGKLGARTLNE